MKNRWIFPVLAAAAAGVIGYGITRYAFCRAAGPDPDRLQNVAFLARELKLDDDQIRKIEALHVEFAEILQECCARHCNARKHLGMALTDDSVDAALVDAYLREICNAYAAGEQATAEHIRRVNEVLDENQQQRFNRMVAASLQCRGCRYCDHDKTPVQMMETQNGADVVVPGRADPKNTGQEEMSHE